MPFLIDTLVAFAFVGTSGFLFRERFEKNYPLGALVSLILFVSTFLTIQQAGLSLGFIRSRDSSAITNTAQVPPPTPADEIFWLTIKDTAAPVLFDEFINKFPASPHLLQARARLSQLQSDRAVAPPPASKPQPALDNSVSAPATGDRFCVRVNGREICE